MTTTPAAERPPPQPAMILVRPQLGENIGAAARALWNFGLDRMRIVAPRDGWPNPKATAMATGAGRLLDQAGLYATVPEATSDCAFVFAATARRRELTKPVLTPEAAMRQARAMAAGGQKIGILFGPERAGLENEDIARVNAIISVPVNPAFASLNLAQCVLLIAYEWRRQAGDGVPPDAVPPERATALEISKLGDHFERRLEAAGFFFPEAKADRMKTNLRNLWSRMALTRADVRMLHGVLRQMARGREGRG